MIRITNHRYIQKLTNILFSQRGILNGSILEYLLAITMYTLIVLALTQGVLLNINTQLFGSAGDATAGFLWLNFADPGIDLTLGHTQYSNYPDGENLSTPAFITYSALWVPLRILSALFGPVTGLNLMMVLGYVGSAAAMYWAIKRLTGNTYAAFIAGFSVAFVPYAMYKSVGHLSYIFSGVFTLAILAFIEIWKNPRTKWALFLGVMAALAFYTDGYYVLLMVVLMLGLLIAGLLYGMLMRFNRQAYQARIKQGLVAIIAFAVLVVPLGVTLMGNSDSIEKNLADNRSDTRVEFQIYRSNVIDFIAPPSAHVIWGDSEIVQSMNEKKNLRSNEGESTNYIAYTLYLLVISGILISARILYSTRGRRQKRREDLENTLLMVAVIVLVCVPLIVSFMFSPEIIIKGVRIPLPGEILLDNGINLWRVPSRFFVILNVVIVLFAAISLHVIMERNKIRSGRSKYLIPAAILSLVAIEYLCYFPSRPFDYNKLPETYSWLRDSNDIEVVAELPLVDPLDMYSADYFTAQQLHGKRLINLKNPTALRVSNVLGDLDNVETRNFLLERGVDAVILRDYASNACRDLSPVGPLIYQEKTSIYDKEEKRNINASLCTYAVKKNREADDVFVRFTRGFNPSPNAPDQSAVVFKDGAYGELAFTDNSLSKVADTGEVHFRTTVNTVIKGDDTLWRVYQDDEIIGSGTLKGGIGEINVIAKSNKLVRITISKPNYSFKLAEVYLSDIVANSIKE